MSLGEKKKNEKFSLGEEYCINMKYESDNLKLAYSIKGKTLLILLKVKLGISYQKLNLAYFIIKVKQGILYQRFKHCIFY